MNRKLKQIEATIIHQLQSLVFVFKSEEMREVTIRKIKNIFKEI